MTGSCADRAQASRAGRLWRGSPPGLTFASSKFSYGTIFVCVTGVGAVVVVAVAVVDAARLDSMLAPAVPTTLGEAAVGDGEGYLRAGVICAPPSRICLSRPIIPPMLMSTAPCGIAGKGIISPLAAPTNILALNPCSRHWVPAQRGRA